MMEVQALAMHLDEEEAVLLRLMDAAIHGKVQRRRYFASGPMTIDRSADK
jgi:hypothetical protein